MSRSNLARRPHWLIAKHKISQFEVLTIGSEDDEAVPVLSFEEEANMYLHLRAETSSEDWRVRETSVGELTSLLYGPCEGVSKVALDPPPEVCGGPLISLLSVECDEFLGVLLEDQFSARRPMPSRIKRATRMTVSL